MQFHEPRTVKAECWIVRFSHCRPFALQGGCLCATWRAAVAVPARDWLQGGLTLTLRATPAAADPAEAAEAVRPRSCGG